MTKNFNASAPGLNAVFIGEFGYNRTEVSNKSRHFFLTSVLCVFYSIAARVSLCAVRNKGVFGHLEAHKASHLQGYVHRGNHITDTDGCV